MSAPETQVPSRYYCQEPGCGRNFPRQTNLNRHVLSTHGKKIREPCGVIRPNHVFNSRRHQKTCKKCREILHSPLNPSQQSGTGTPTSAPTSTIQTPSHDATLDPSEAEIDYGYIEYLLEVDALLVCSLGYSGSPWLNVQRLGKLSANFDTELTFD